MTPKHLISTNAFTLAPSAINTQAAISHMVGGNGDFNNIEAQLVNDPTLVTTGALSEVTLKQSNQYVQVTNQSNIPVYLDVYLVALRQNVGISTTTSNPENAFFNGYNDQSGGAITATSIPFGVDPFIVPKFTKNYKVLRKQTVLFHAGAIKEFRKLWRYKDRRTRKESDEDTSVNERAYYRGMFFVLRPPVVNDATGHEGTSATVKLDFITRVDFKWYASAGYFAQIKVSSALGALATAGQTTLEATDATATLVVS